MGHKDRWTNPTGGQTKQQRLEPTSIPMQSVLFNLLLLYSMWTLPSTSHATNQVDNVHEVFRQASPIRLILTCHQPHICSEPLWKCAWTARDMHNGTASTYQSFDHSGPASKSCVCLTSSYFHSERTTRSPSAPTSYPIDLAREHKRQTEYPSTTWRVARKVKVDVPQQVLIYVSWTNYALIAMHSRSNMKSKMNLHFHDVTKEIGH